MKNRKNKIGKAAGLSIAFLALIFGWAIAGAGTDDATIVSWDIPSSMSPGSTYLASVKVKNTGSTTWTKAAGYKLGAANDSDPLCSSGRILLGSNVSVAPGTSHVFKFYLKAPNATGNYVTDWRMVLEGVHWFGATVTKTVSVTSPNNASILSNNFPAAMTPGSTFNAQVAVKNIGTTTWTIGAGYKLGGIGNSDPFVSTARVPLPSGVSVAPGATYTFNFVLTAPATNGSYVSDWRMIREGVQWFGGSFSKTIVVGVAPPPTAFSLSSPANGAIVTTTPTLAWTDSTGETSYKVQIDNDSTFSTPIAVYSTTATTFALPILANGTTYYWRVIAKNANGQTVASNAPRSFTTVAAANPPSAFGLLSPASGAAVSTTPLLSWQNSNNGDSYVLQIDGQSSFTAPLAYENPNISANVTSFQIPPGVLANGQSYFWRVIAVNGSGQTTASNAPFVFSTGGGGNPGADTALDARRKSMLQTVDQLLKIGAGDGSLPGPNLTVTPGPSDAYYLEKALAIFALIDIGAADASRISEANKVLRYSINKWAVTNPQQIIGQYATRWEHRSRTLAMRVLLFYHNWLEPDVKQEFDKRADYYCTSPYAQSSENIRFTTNQAIFLSHEYRNKTNLSSYTQVKNWMIDTLTAIGNDGVGEWGTTYNMWTMGAILNIADLAQNTTVKNLATMVVDHWLAQQSGFAKNGKLCTSAVRRYDHWVIGYIEPQTVVSQLFFTGGTYVSVKDFGTWEEFAASNYKPPAIVDGLYDSNSDVEAKMTTVGIWRHHSYCGKDYMIASMQMPQGIPSNLHNLVTSYVQSTKNIWNEIIPHTLPPGDHKYCVNERSFGYKNMAYVHGGGLTKAAWGGPGYKTNVPVRLYYAKDYAVEIQGKWAFLTDGVIYVAWGTTQGNPIIDPDSGSFTSPTKGSWLRSSFNPGDAGETFVIEVGDAASFGSYEGFKNDIVSRNANPSASSYTAKDGANVEFGPGYAKVNGQQFNPDTYPRAQMPGVNDNNIGGEFTLDFNNATWIGTVNRMSGNLHFGN